MPRGYTKKHKPRHPTFFLSPNRGGGGILKKRKKSGFLKKVFFFFFFVLTKIPTRATYIRTYVVFVFNSPAWWRVWLRFLFFLVYLIRLPHPMVTYGCYSIMSRACLSEIVILNCGSVTCPTFFGSLGSFRVKR